MFEILVVTILFNLFAIETILIRPRLFKTKLFKPMVHNFKLSIIPIVILVGTIVAQLLISWLGAVLKSNLVTSISLVVLVIGLIAWFLFLPNSGYLITELNLTHRDVDKSDKYPVIQNINVGDLPVTELWHLFRALYSI